jgi:rfaE bifunctional protein nucleotidyltransferase chain/domain
VQDHPSIAREDPEGGQQVTDGPGGLGRDPDGEVLVLDARPDRRDEVELASDLVPDRRQRLGVGHPVGEEAIRVLARVRQPKRDAGEQADERRGEGALRVDGADDRRVEAAGPEPLDEGCRPGGIGLDVGRARRIVFTNGCFDLLHRGHVAYLRRAKALGDVLIVAVNGDESVRRLKGPERPLNGLDDRLGVLEALSCIDHVVAFDEPTPAALIDIVRPDVYVKGGDYTRERLPEAPQVEALGGQVRILPYMDDHSTTGIIERLRQPAGTSG